MIEFNPKIGQKTIRKKNKIENYPKKGIKNYPKNRIENYPKKRIENYPSHMARASVSGWIKFWVASVNQSKKLPN